MVEICLHLSIIEWRNLMAEKEVYDLVIVGGSPAASAAALIVEMKKAEQNCKVE